MYFVNWPYLLYWLYLLLLFLLLLLLHVIARFRAAFLLNLRAKMAPDSHIFFFIDCNFVFVNFIIRNYISADINGIFKNILITIKKE
jgi:hypothetical protein